MKGFLLFCKFVVFVFGLFTYCIFSVYLYSETIKLLNEISVSGFSYYVDSFAIAITIFWILCYLCYKFWLKEVNLLRDKLKKGK